MAIEIEHKYLVISDAYRLMASEMHTICQGYLQSDPERTVRVRTYDERGYITVKGRNAGDTRLEFEYEIPFDDAAKMLALCPRCLAKKRFIVVYEGKRWEVDEFDAPLAPLVVAEIELADSNEVYELPPFVGDNVTGDPQYYNSSLIRRIIAFPSAPDSGRES